MENTSIDTRKKQDLEDAFLEADNIIMKKYMSDICSYEVKKMDSELVSQELNSVFRLNKIEKLVFNADENNLEKLMNVYNAVGMCGGSIVNIIISDGKKVEYYLGTRTPDVNAIATCQDILVSSLAGNFQGSTVVLQKKGSMNECVDKIFNGDLGKAVTVVSGIPGYRSEDNKENAKFVQGIERVIDSMRGKAFALVTISSPLDSKKITSIRDGYENLYTHISPFAETQLSYNESESNAVAETITDGITKTVGESLSTTVSNSTSNTEGYNENKSYNGSVILLGASSSNGKDYSKATQEGTAYADSKNKSNTDSHSVARSDTYTTSTGRNLQISIENKAVKNLMQKIDDMIERIEASVDIGLWNTATYCLAEDTQTSTVLASAVEALCRGEKSTVESFVVGTWSNISKRDNVKEYLSKFVHPVLLVEGKSNRLEVNPSSLISGKELVIEAGLPQKSIPGVPVSEMTAFSRNVITEYAPINETLKLGNVYHMGTEEHTEVNLDIESLTAHTLITGSTGSGKSNIVYHMLNELKGKSVKFLVIEPAKGEYKNVFGHEKDVLVLGTNEKYTQLLRINPFKFPKTVHVLEHIDRLIEIFNVCWPMYAAMPAVLKEAVLEAYENCGWDLDNSENEYGEDIFPSFRDLQIELVNVIQKSAYSEEVKGNYIGSLATRVKSLTNGINGKIFTNSDLDYSRIFDENVIVDLSRVGSAESKSLIMGILVMALNEYRMDQSQNSMNQNLKHITVLEEAHNLLRNTSITGSSGSEEGTGVAGKSVEMITNSIAEMRTYGEGFIIVDQSPSVIDISAIRNTNTKIIMRLPEEVDRQQAGKSAALKDNQIPELAKLNRGIAVVYQNNWLDPVLCKICKAEINEVPYIHSCEEVVKRADYAELLAMLMKNRVDEKVDIDIDKVENIIEMANFSTRTKIELSKIVKGLKESKDAEILQKHSFVSLSELVVDVLNIGDKLYKCIDNSGNCESIQRSLNKEIEKCAKGVSKELELAVTQCIIRQAVELDSSKVEAYSKWREYAVEQRKRV